ncbi:MAG: hypothetical protein IJ035_07755 [Oscillospiraceae bacterium]|nr:hypothetical protein [Oscillospiraceae bacterium]
MKLNRIISIILSAIISITLFTGCEKLESIPEETTVSETTAATIPADLTEEEMAIWESMPDIVTMRVYNDFITETTEILYITKYGEMKSFISDEYYGGYKDDSWIIQKINNNDATVIDTTDIHKLIELYNMLLLIEPDCEMTGRLVYQQEVYVEVSYSYKIYGNLKNNINMLFAYGYTLEDNIFDDLYGEEIFCLYHEIDPFILI